MGHYKKTIKKQLKYIDQEEAKKYNQKNAKRGLQKTLKKTVITKGR